MKELTMGGCENRGDHGRMGGQRWLRKDERSELATEGGKDKAGYGKIRRQSWL